MLTELQQEAIKTNSICAGVTYTYQATGKPAKHCASWKCKDTVNIDPLELAKGYGHQQGMTTEPITSRKSQGIRLSGFWVTCPISQEHLELDHCLYICKGKKSRADIVNCRMQAYHNEK